MTTLRSLGKRLARALRPASAKRTESPVNVHLSCLVDNDPRFRMEAWNWLHSLRAAGTGCTLFVHHLPGALDDRAKAEFEALGARLVETPGFGEGNARYCNKICQLDTPEVLDADFVILSDADLVFVQDPARLVREGQFRAKLVDAPNPPLDLIEALYARAGLPAPTETVPLEISPDQRTLRRNFNGGLYIVPGAVARQLAPLWRKHAAFCLEQGDLLGDYVIHADQLGMGMALAELDTPIDPLPAGENLPTHLGKEALSRLPEQPVGALHYHWRLDQHGLPMHCGVAWIDAAIERARATLTEARRAAFSNDIFWDFRYAKFPELGSGLGSRDEVLAHKHALLTPYVTMIDAGSILDVGCGDLELFGPLPARDYTGIDVSREALEIARTKRPDWNFETWPIAEAPDGSYDYTSCIDVMIHQPGAAAAEQLARDLVRVARKGVLFSAHSAAIEGAGISFDSSHIKDFIAAMPEISGVHEIGSYRDVTLYFAEKGMGERHSVHDAGLQELAIGAAHAEDVDLLKEMVAYSRAKIGFYPRTVIRMHEYPWFATQMRDCAGQRILDVGAGVCCLPFLLAEHGAEVTTIDKHGLIRNEQPMDGWNEWGFLDYGQIDPRIRSFNMDMTKFGEGECFDIVYSVSVIEHMPAEIRRAAITRIAQLLRPGGTVLLSLDITPGTDALWNYNEGEIVDPEDHGSFGDIKAELAAAGLPVVAEESLRGMPMSRTDVMYLTCRKA